MFDYICCVILSIIIFKEVNLVNKVVWVDKDLASQISLLRKLLEEATWSCLGKNASQPSLTIGSSRHLVCSFIRHLFTIWSLGSLTRYLECAWRFRFQEHCSLVRFEPCSPSSLGKTPFSSLSFFQNHFQRPKLFLHHPQPPLATTNQWTTHYQYIKTR